MTEHYFETHEPIALYVENGKGVVTIRATDTTETTVSLEGPDADETRVELDGRDLVVVAPSHRGPFSGDRRLEISVVLPTGSDLTTKLGSSDLVVDGSLSTVRARSGSGDLTLDVITGDALVETGSGDVRVAVAEQDLRVKSGSGDVSVDESRTELVVSTGSGDVQVGTSSGPAVVKTGSGDLLVARSSSDVSLTTGSGDAVIRHASSGRVSVKGASGDVRVGVPAGTPVWTDVTTISGDVRSTLASAGQPEPGQAYVEVRAKTVSGDIHLAQV